MRAFSPDEKVNEHYRRRLIARRPIDRANRAHSYRAQADLTCKRKTFMSAQIIIIMGSKGDLAQAQNIAKTLKTLDISYQMRVCSAHKATSRLLAILHDYEQQEGPIVYVTIAGRSNALSAVIDANTRFPVIACPPYSDRFGGADIFSSLRLPSGIASPTILEPEGAALLAAKILALSDGQLRQRVLNYKQKLVSDLEQADAEVQQE
jgi:phosphoribosylaminoimidazole carboxylase PurE protein